MGALDLDAQKYGSSRFGRSKVWELSVWTLKSMGALDLDAQKCGSSRFKRSKCACVFFTVNYRDFDKCVIAERVQHPTFV